MSAVMLNAFFTTVLAWALIVVVVLIQPHGVARVALACVMAGAAIAIIAAWKEPRS
jgi:hypothetical protein